MKPFINRKIPISNTLEEFNALLHEFPNFSICPYLAYKDETGWERSTSRVYMNQVLDNFLYVPMNIAKNDTRLLTDFINHIKNDQRIIGINITQPHKSNPVVSQILFGDNHQINYDALLRSDNGELQPFDLNGPSFVGWYLDKVGSLTDKTIILIGVGGVGEPLAKAFARQKPARLFLIDINDKSNFAKSLGATYSDLVERIENELGDDFILINAAGKEGSGGNSAQKLLDDFSDKNNVFVDLRPHLDIDIVSYAKSKGWRAYTGNGMNACNDYTLLQNIAERLNIKDIVSFDDFDKLVSDAS
jgi:shikimate 5-dehydrogenase